MPHLIVLYIRNLDAKTDMAALCRVLADTMLVQLDAAGSQVFPTGGTRVLAYAAEHSGVADGAADYGFVYPNLRMAAGRTDAVKQRAGDELLTVARAHLEPVFARLPLGLTLQIDESPGQVYDGKHSTLHPLFRD